MGTSGERAEGDTRTLAYHITFTHRLNKNRNSPTLTPVPSAGLLAIADSLTSGKHQIVRVNDPYIHASAYFVKLENTLSQIIKIC